MGIDFNKMNEGGSQDESVITKIPEAENNRIHFHPGAIVSSESAGNALERAKAVFKAYEKQIDQVTSSINGFEIESDDDAATFTQTVGTVKKLIKAIEAKRKGVIKKEDLFVRTVNGFVRPFRVRLEGLEKTGKQKIGKYNYSLEIKRRADEKAVQEQAVADQAKIDAQAKNAGVKSITLPPPVLPKKTQSITTETATGSTRFKKTFEVVDFAKLDDAYKEVNKTKLQSAIDAGLRPPGVKIKEIPVTSIRT